MKKLTIAALALTLASCAIAPKKGEGECSCAPDALADGKTMRLTVGIQKFIDLPFEPSTHGVFVGNPTLLATTIVKAAGKIQIALHPQKSGETNLTIKDSQGDTKYQQLIVVNAVDLIELSNEVTELLKEIPAAKVKLMKDHVVIDGDMPSPVPMGRIATLLQDRHYLDFVLNLTRLSPQFFTDLAARTQEELKKTLPNVTARAVNNQIWLEGKVETIEQGNQAAKIASLLLPAVMPADPLEHAVDAEKLPTRALVQNLLKIEK